MSARQRPMVLGVAGHLNHATLGWGRLVLCLSRARASLQVIVVDQRGLARSLHHPYMEEVISEAEEANVDRYVEIGGSGAGFGVFRGIVALGHEDLLLWVIRMFLLHSNARMVTDVRPTCVREVWHKAMGEFTNYFVISLNYTFCRVTPLNYTYIGAKEHPNGIQHQPAIQPERNH